MVKDEQGNFADEATQDGQQIFDAAEQAKDTYDKAKDIADAIKEHKENKEQNNQKNQNEQNGKNSPDNQNNNENNNSQSKNAEKNTKSSQPGTTDNNTASSAANTGAKSGEGAGSTIGGGGAGAEKAAAEKGAEQAAKEGAKKGAQEGAKVAAEQAAGSAVPGIGNAVMAAVEVASLFKDEIRKVIIVALAFFMIITMFITSAVPTLLGKEIFGLHGEQEYEDSDYNNGAGEYEYDDFSKSPYRQAFDDIKKEISPVIKDAKQEAVDTAVKKINSYLSNISESISADDLAELNSSANGVDFGDKEDNNIMHYNVKLKNQSDEVRDDDDYTLAYLNAVYSTSQKNKVHFVEEGEEDDIVDGKYEETEFDGTDIRDMKKKLKKGLKDTYVVIEDPAKEREEIVDVNYSLKTSYTTVKNDAVASQIGSNAVVRNEKGEVIKTTSLNKFYKKDSIVKGTLEEKRLKTGEAPLSTMVTETEKVTVTYPAETKTYKYIVFPITNVNEQIYLTAKYDYIVVPIDATYRNVTVEDYPMWLIENGTYHKDAWLTEGTKHVNLEKNYIILIVAFTCQEYYGSDFVVTLKAEEKETYYMQTKTPYKLTAPVEVRQEIQKWTDVSVTIPAFDKEWAWDAFFNIEEFKDIDNPDQIYYFNKKPKSYYTLNADLNKELSEYNELVEVHHGNIFDAAFDRSGYSFTLRKTTDTGTEDKTVYLTVENIKGVACQTCKFDEDGKEMIEVVEEQFEALKNTLDITEDSSVNVSNPNASYEYQIKSKNNVRWIVIKESALSNYTENKKISSDLNIKPSTTMSYDQLINELSKVFNISDLEDVKSAKYRDDGLFEVTYVDSVTVNKDGEEVVKAGETVLWMSTDRYKSAQQFINPLKYNDGGTIINSDFGSRTDPFSGATKFHSGIDLGHYGGITMGWKISTPADGVVDYVDYLYDGGNTIFIKHDNGFVTKFYHMKSRAIVEVGTRVTQGQVVGYVGNSGASTGAHLHWSLLKNGTLVNPVDYCDDLVGLPHL